MVRSFELASGTYKCIINLLLVSTFHVVIIDILRLNHFVSTCHELLTNYENIEGFPLSLFYQIKTYLEFELYKSKLEMGYTGMELYLY